MIEPVLRFKSHFPLQAVLPLSCAVKHARPAALRVQRGRALVLQCGLDKSSRHVSMETQEAALLAQLRLGKQLHRPISVCALLYRVETLPTASLVLLTMRPAMMLLL